MIEQATGRSTGRGRAGRRLAGLTALGLILLVGPGTWVGAIGGTPAFASGETNPEGGGAPGGTQSSPTNASDCPSPNPPNQLTLVAGTPQTTTLDADFAGLQVALSNSDGCAVTGAGGVPVTFSAPASGASGHFATSNSETATVGADASGAVAAPTFTANGTAGSYTVTANSPYGSVSFSLTNTAAGIPTRLAEIPLKHSSTRVGSRFPQSLRVRALDAQGNPVAGAAVTFTLGAGSAAHCGAGTAASASFAGGGTQGTATTDAGGIATSPALIASAAAGSFTATASISDSSAGGGASGAESTGNAAASGVAPVGFSLVNLAGKAANIAPGVGSTQSTPAGSAFPIRLAVTVTDADKNPVGGALVAFSAPAAGASGRFTLYSHSRDGHRHTHISHTRTVKVKTGACGIAVAPPFTASGQPGGYVVQASAKPARPAAFALVNEAPGQAL
jgi:protocatechuate 3,4-dioxygenase beta subunit